jgi:putative acetyltransferase
MARMASHVASVLSIQPESPGDVDAIDAVVRAAFGGDEEAALVAAVRASDRFVPTLSLVAVTPSGEVVGHVLLSHVDVVGTAGARTEVLSLAPLSVAPPSQRQGVGLALLREALSRARALGAPLIVVEGHPAYYPKVGFAPADGLGISLPLPAGAAREVAMALLVTAAPGEVQGRVEYPPAFAGVLAADATSAPSAPRTGHA